LVEEDVPERLVHHDEAESELGKKVLVNVVYTGTSTLKDKKLS
jgi:hypothetical protein